MSYNAQRIAIESRFKTAWEAAYPAIPISWPNVKLPKTDSGYVRLDILNGDSALKGMGSSKLYRCTGIISIDVYQPQLTGIKNIDLYADTITTIFRGQSFGGLVCRAVNRTDLGLVENFWRTNLSVPFFRNEYS